LPLYSVAFTTMAEVRPVSKLLIAMLHLLSVVG
jgi:hypothetical protein